MQRKTATHHSLEFYFLREAWQWFGVLCVSQERQKANWTAEQHKLILNLLSSPMGQKRKFSHRALGCELRSQRNEAEQAKRSMIHIRNSNTLGTEDCVNAERSHTSCEILIFWYPEVLKWKLRLVCRKGAQSVPLKGINFTLFFLLVSLLLLGFTGVKV